MPGPVIQDDLVSITLRFRMFRYAFVFVQILLFTPDCCFQEILCRTFPSEPVRIFQLSTDTYGTSCVPYFATIYSKKLAKFGETILLQVARIISKDFMWISTSQTRSYRLARRKNNIEAIILYSKQNALVEMADNNRQKLLPEKSLRTTSRFPHSNHSTEPFVYSSVVVHRFNSNNCMDSNLIRMLPSAYNVTQNIWLQLN